MPLKVRNKKAPGEYRYVSVLGGKLQIKHEYSPQTLSRLRKHVKGASYHPDQIGGGYFLLEPTRQNALAILKFGIENEYRFQPAALTLLNDIASVTQPK